MRRIVPNVLLTGRKSLTPSPVTMTRMVTRSLVISNHHHYNDNSRRATLQSTSSTVQKRHFSSSDSKNATDKELHDSYSGVWPRISVLMELLEESGREKYDALMKGNVISAGKQLIGINLYADLQHPLLRKYQFDPIDFVKGAKEAFTQIRRAVTSMEIKDAIHTAHAEELLQFALNPPLFKLYMAAFREIEARDYKITLQDLVIKDTIIGAATTCIVDEEFYKEEEHTYNRLAEVLRSFATESKDLQFDSIERRYPLGSVVANVDVIYDTEEIYLKIDELKQEETIHRLNRTVVRFQSCISGQNELDWVVTMMDSTELK